MPGPHRALTIHDGTAAVTLNGIRCTLVERQQRNEWVVVRLRRDEGRNVAEVVQAQIEIGGGALQPTTDGFPSDG